VAWPHEASSAPGFVINLDTPSFLLTVAGLALLIGLLLLLRSNTRSRRALAGYLEATAIDIAFLAFALVLVLVLFLDYPSGNRDAWALAQVVLTGYWLTFSIPVVTVGFSVHSRTRGSVAWKVPSLLFAGALFVGIFAFWYFAL
jgi:hypothetical protein